MSERSARDLSKDSTPPESTSTTSLETIRKAKSGPTLALHIPIQSFGLTLGRMLWKVVLRSSRPSNMLPSSACQMSIAQTNGRFGVRTKSATETLGRRESVTAGYNLAFLPSLPTLSESRRSSRSKKRTRLESTPSTCLPWVSLSPSLSMTTCCSMQAKI